MILVLQLFSDKFMRWQQYGHQMHKDIFRGYIIKHFSMVNFTHLFFKIKENSYVVSAYASPHSIECPGYDIKQSDREAPVLYPFIVIASWSPITQSGSIWKGQIDLF